MGKMEVIALLDTLVEATCVNEVAFLLSFVFPPKTGEIVAYAYSLGHWKGSVKEANSHANISSNG